MCSRGTSSQNLEISTYSFSVAKAMQLYITEKHTSIQKAFSTSFFFKQPLNCTQHSAVLDSPSQLDVPLHFSLS